MTKLLTVLGAWLALSCFMCSGSAMRVAFAGQALVVPGSGAVPADVSQAASCFQLSEAEGYSALQRAGAEPGLYADFRALAHGLGFAEFAWRRAWLGCPKREAMLGLALARAPPAWRG